ncbi:hypothetical protein Tco_0584297 [Tanacetum coccineum]
MYCGKDGVKKGIDTILAVWMVMEIRANHHPKMKFLTSTFKATADASPPKYAVAFVNGDQYYGAKASIIVWTPAVIDLYDFSLSQLWVISGSFGNDLNTVEAR